MNNMEEMARLHSAGATVRHTSPFTMLPSHKNEHQLSAEFYNIWVVPYYMGIGKYGDTTWITSIQEHKNDITEEICLQLLGDFNWRTRLVGSYFAAVKGYNQLIDIIGTHLLKSEVCYVGHIYALTLAFFNTEKSIQYLDRYLAYYLTKPELYFDQKDVMEALLFLDKQNGTPNSAKHEDSWKKFQDGRNKQDKNYLEGLTNMLKNFVGEKTIAEHLTSEEKNNIRETLNTAYYDDHIKILQTLSNVD
ncbi:DUF6000 family protein [Chitinophaga sp. CF418]|uniref:DUF6000 family protein n=1 Tax=Chitinophaga sp. CF418 TaxID=1855287 RepID=UPI00091C4FAF|nr:DUF6000 family protein [Chitinophaga sp. CF418]SHN23972.1 hypothetical protein SAMN05216311_107214 [Chitinophaga sp. CF418]